MNFVKFSNHNSRTMNEIRTMEVQFVPRSSGYRQLFHKFEPWNNNIKYWITTLKILETFHWIIYLWISRHNYWATALNGNCCHILHISSRIDNRAIRIKRDQKMLLKFWRREIFIVWNHFLRTWWDWTKRGGRENYRDGKHLQNKNSASLIFITWCDNYEPTEFRLIPIWMYLEDNIHFSLQFVQNDLLITSSPFNQALSSVDRAFKASSRASGKFLEDPLEGIC